MNNMYKKEHMVSYSEVDSNYKLRLDYIFSHFQDIAGLHSEEMGIDGKSLLENSNVFWVLTKVKLKISELPHFNDNITLTTWPFKANGVRFARDFLINNGDKPLVMGSSEWCMLDYTTKKLRRVDSVVYPHDMSFREDRSGAGEFLRMKETVDEKDFNHSYRSSFVDIDTNKHTNNVAYLRMILNCFSPEEFEEISFKEIQVSFLAQTFYGDEIKVYKKKTDYGFYIEGKHNGIAVFNCFMI